MKWEKLYLKFVLLSVLVGCFISVSNITLANSYPVMSQEQAQAILDFAIGLDNYVCLYDVNSLNSGDTSVKQQFQNMSATQVATAFNDMASQIAVDFTWDNVTIVIGKNYNSTANPKINPNIIFYINSKGLTSSNLGNNRTYPSVYTSDNFNYIKQVTGDSVNYIRLYNNPYNNTIIKQKGTNLELKIFPKFTPTLSQDELYITDMNYVLSINTSTKWQYNNVLYVIGDTILTFDNNGNVIGNEPINGDIETENGYYFYDSSLEQLQEFNINRNTNAILNEWWFIGDNLTSTYNYYYISGDTKISVNEYMNINERRNSGDTGTFFEPYITRENIRLIPINKVIKLDITINNGDVIVANEFPSFTLYNSFIPPEYISGTITNGSGETTGRITNREHRN